MFHVPHIVLEIFISTYAVYFILVSQAPYLLYLHNNSFVRIVAQPLI